MINIITLATIYFDTLLTFYHTLPRHNEEDRSFIISHCYDTVA